MSARHAFWRLIARVLGLGSMSVRPSWHEVKYKSNGRLQDARHRIEYARLKRTIEFEQYQTWRLKWILSQAAKNEKRDRMRAIRARLNVMLSRP